MAPVFLTHALRTPIGKARGTLAGCRPDDLAALLLSEIRRRHPSDCPWPDDVILGATNQAGEDNRNVARMALLLADFPEQVPGVTVNRLCGSGLEAVIQAARLIATADGDSAIAGGVESMSRAPFALARPTEAFPKRVPELVDTALGWRFINPTMKRRFEPESMGRTAENVANLHNISRADQDAFALLSHQRAVAAQAAGTFANEIVAVPIPATRRTPETLVETDEGPRPDSSLGALERLPAVFADNGSVTAGNASPLSDGAAVVALASEALCQRSGLAPLARITASASAGVEPNLMGLGPIAACEKLFARTGLGPDDFDVIELNEAFAAQALACMRALKFDPERVNPYGGAIALGHPIGCSGARIVTTLLHAMARMGARRGLATLCIGVGQGLALALEQA